MASSDSFGIKEIDVPSVLIGVGAGVAGLDYLGGITVAGFGALAVGAGLVGFGYLQHQSREAQS